MKRSAFRRFVQIPTRWMDQDAFGHVNNVQYYSYMDTAVCTFLLAQPDSMGSARPFVVHSSCDYITPIAFPSEVSVGLRVAKLGTSSCHYEIGIFDGSAEDAAAVGKFVHVWTGAESGRPTPIPGHVREAYETILAAGA
eukprot:TRINITY_DN2189_c0_g3_i1.p1 TRINITY_DN2189_c0_g3~~TRINITY_DN2189_c0_g3_i1.p1  ORF type:complete len:139 (+),score=36.34 TRINITY_DN2189_c0_g3_i1:55-471(+)